MAIKKIVSPEEIVDSLNSALSKSTALDGDCQKCRVHQVNRISNDDAEQLGRNWNIVFMNGECGGGCHAVLVDITRAIGDELEASWP